MKAIKGNRKEGKKDIISHYFQSKNEGKVEVMDGSKNLG